MKFFVSLMSGIALAFAAHAAPTLEDARRQSIEIMNELPPQLSEKIEDVITGDGYKAFAGAQMSLVQNGETTFIKGWGYADIPSATPVDPTQTKFRIGSVSKLFTATAIAMLIDEGAIDLAAPANSYLKRFQLPTPYGEPTVEDLLTHRAGYEENHVNTSSNARHDLPVSTKEIQSFLPKQLRVPGQKVVYSNFGASTLGAIIEDVSGMTYGAFLEERIFTPLGMKNSGVGYGPDLPENHASPSNIYQDGKIVTHAYYPKHPFFAPSGGVYSTAEDMTKFMLAHLEAGETERSAKLMSADAYQLMQHARTWNNAEGVYPQYGFIIWVDDYNGYKTLGHTGNVQDFRAYMVIAPDLNLGLFIGAVGDNPLFSFKDEWLKLTRDDLIRRVLVPFNAGQNMLQFLIGERMTHATGAAPTPNADLSKYAGVYWNIQRSQTTPEEYLSIHEVMKVEDPGDGSLLIKGKRHLPVGDHTFAHVDSYRVVRFKADDQGKIVEAMNEYPAPWEKTEGLHSPDVLDSIVRTCGFGALVIGGVLLFLKGGLVQFQIARMAILLSGIGTMGAFLWPTLAMDIPALAILLEPNWRHFVWLAFGNIGWIAAFIALGAAAWGIFHTSQQGGVIAPRTVLMAVAAPLLVLNIYALTSLNFVGFNLAGWF